MNINTRREEEEKEKLLFLPGQTTAGWSAVSPTAAAAEVIGRKQTSVGVDRSHSAVAAAKSPTTLSQFQVGGSLLLQQLQRQERDCSTWPQGFAGSPLDPTRKPATELNRKVQGLYLGGGERAAAAMKQARKNRLKPPQKYQRHSREDKQILQRYYHHRLNESTTGKRQYEGYIVLVRLSEKINKTSRFR